MCKPLSKRPPTSSLHKNYSESTGGKTSWPARVVYIWRNAKFPVFLITVFPKNEMGNLTMNERNAVKKRADSIFTTYGSQR